MICIHNFCLSVKQFYDFIEHLYSFCYIKFKNENLKMPQTSKYNKDSKSVQIHHPCLLIP